MQSRCPHCHAVLDISPDQLQQGQRQVTCTQCESTFDALAALADESPHSDSDKGDRQDASPPAFTPFVSHEPEYKERKPVETPRRLGPLPWEQDAEGIGPHRSLWAFGIVLLLLFLAGQVYIFEGERLAQNERIRPWLIKLCKPVGCTLPTYRDISRIDVIDRSLSPLSDGNLEFLAVFVNNAKFPQRPPALKLTLLS